MHSSGMRTARLLTISQHALCPGGVPAWGCTCQGGCTCPGTPPPAVDRQTPVKTYPSQTSFAGGNNCVYIRLHTSPEASHFWGVVIEFKLQFLQFPKFVECDLVNPVCSHIMTFLQTKEYLTSARTCKLYHNSQYWSAILPHTLGHQEPILQSDIGHTFSCPPIQFYFSQNSGNPEMNVLSEYYSIFNCLKLIIS